MNYTELHLHTHYSILDGLNTPTEYMARAKELGMTHLAVTDHGTLTGHRDFQIAAASAGITPILGVEAYISATDRFDKRTKASRQDGTSVYNHLGILAMNQDGLVNLNALSKEAWNSGFYYKPRIDIEILGEYSENLIVLSGCLNGLLSKSIEAGSIEKALDWGRTLKGIFGDRFFIEIQGHNPPEINSGLLHVADKLNVLPVVTSDCHYARKEDLWLQEALLILSSKPSVAKGYSLEASQKMEWLERFNYLYPDRTMTFQEFEIYLRSAMEQKELLLEQGIDESPILNTQIVASMIGQYEFHKGLDVLPRPKISVSSYDDELRRLVEEGAIKRGHAGNPIYQDRIEEELRVIKDKNIASYFLVLADIVSWAHSQGIFIGPGRGSGISSLVNYNLFITNIDPIEYDLQFFRFLDPDRDDMPDVDIDIEINRRWEIKEYAKKKYGNVSNIITFGAMGGKSALKAAATVLKIPHNEINSALASLSDDPEFPVLKKYEVDTTNEKLVAFKKKYPEVLTLAQGFDGRIRSCGMHAGGTLISRVPIEELVPMQTAEDPHDGTKNRVPVAGVDMRQAADIGLIKYDFLGLNNLTVILDTIKRVKERHGIEIDPYEITLDDPEVFKMLSAGHTNSVFQCEGGPYTNTILAMGGVDSFDELVASNALVRPGAADSSVGKNYIRGKKTGDFSYIHQSTMDFTKDTYGQILFQEQQMLLCVHLAGMTMSEANQVRQAIGKKNAEKLALWGPRFIQGASEKLSEARAVAVWEDLEKSAEYAFNKAHSVGYSMISYWTAWFKLYYPGEYMTSVINNISGTDKNIKTIFALMEAKRLGVKIKMPHINYSDVDSIDDSSDSIRLGLKSIKYISDKVGVKIIDNGPYKSFEHFKSIASTKGSGINSRAIAALNAVGAAEFVDNPRNGNERENYFEYLNIPAFAINIEPQIRNKMRTVDAYDPNDTFFTFGMVFKTKSGPGWMLVEYLDNTGSAGSFTDPSASIEKGKMYVFLISDNRIIRYATIEDIVENKAGALSKYLMSKKISLDADEYRCIAFKERKTKSGYDMASAVFVDSDSRIFSTTLFGNVVNDIRIPCLSSSKMRLLFAEDLNGKIKLKEVLK